MATKAPEPGSVFTVVITPVIADPSTISIEYAGTGGSISHQFSWNNTTTATVGNSSYSKASGERVIISVPGYLLQEVTLPYQGDSISVTLVPLSTGTFIDILVDSNNKVVTYNGTPVCLALPSEYTRVPYLESTGTQYINTGFIPTAGTTAFKHTIVFESNSSSNSNKYICGTGVSEGRSGNLRISGNSLNGLYVGTSGAVAIISTTTISLNTKYTIIIDLHNQATNTVTLNGTSIGNTSTSTITSTKQMQLFALSNSYLPTGLRIYSSKIEKDGKLVYYLIAARRNSDSVLGMYDLIQNRFLTNAGSGSFITAE